MSQTEGREDLRADTGSIDVRKNPAQHEAVPGFSHHWDGYVGLRMVWCAGMSDIPPVPGRGQAMRKITRIILRSATGTLGIAAASACDIPIEIPLQSPITGETLCPTINIVSFTISEPDFAMRSGASVTVHVKATDAAGKSPCFVFPDWTSSNPRVATVKDGVVSSLTDGETVIRASYAGLQDSVRITVKTPTLTALIIELPPNLLAGQRANVSLSGRDEAGNIHRNLVATFASADPAIATVTNEGRIHAVRPGAVEIHAFFEGREVKNAMSITTNAPAVKFTAISAGYWHSCGIAAGDTIAEGTLFCWGQGNYGELGIGSSTGQDIPKPVISGGVRFAAVDAGYYHTCAVSLAGDAYCWGGNYSGQLGDGTTVAHNTPVRISGNVKFKNVAVGMDHSCGLALDGSAYCWGRMKGQSSNAPARVFDVPRLKQLTSEFGMACGLTENNETYCWGEGEVTYEHLTFSKPTRVGALAFVSIASGAWHTCGLTAQGRTWCWGSNERGVFAPSSPDLKYALEPRELPGDVAFMRIYAGAGFTCGIIASGEYCVGRMPLSTTTYFSAMTPTPIPGAVEHSFTIVSGRGSHGCAIDQKGGVWCWGDERIGAVGAGVGTVVDEPLQIRIE